MTGRGLPIITTERVGDRTVTQALASAVTMHGRAEQWEAWGLLDGAALNMLSGWYAQDLAAAAQVSGDE